MVHFTTPATSGNWALYLYAGIAGSTTGVTVRFNKIKLEEGNMATSWSASPEDTENSMTQISTSVSNLDAEMENRVLALIDSLGLSEQFASASEFVQAVSDIDLIHSDLTQKDSDMTLTFNRLKKTEDGLDQPFSSFTFGDETTAYLIWICPPAIQP